MNRKTDADIIEDLLNKEYRIIDILPGRVDEKSAVRYFAAEKYFLKEENLKQIRKSFAHLLIKLNCYFDMRVSFDNSDIFQTDIDPELLATRIISLPLNGFFRALADKDHIMIDLDGSDTWMTVYGADEDMARLIKTLARSEGLFLWTPETQS